METTEFIDSANTEELFNRGMLRDRSRHGDIICAAMRKPDVIVTGCTAGDLIFWRFEFSGPFMRLSVENPTQQLQIVDIKRIDATRSGKVPEGKRTRKTKKNKTLRGLRKRFETL